MTRAVLLLNLGGPETLADVKPFLFHLFEDPEILRIHFSPARKLAAWLIATARAKKSRALYASIGGGSPIRRWTDRQAAGVERLLREQGRETRVCTAFTCSPPFVEDVVAALAQQGVRKFTALPLYPQYSFTTTKGSLERTRRAVQRFAPGAELEEIGSWPEHPLFLQAHAELVRETARQFSSRHDNDIHLLFSAHSIPEKLVTEWGDPYKQEVERTVRGVLEKAEWKGPWSLAWQSKLGPVKWLEPSTSQVIQELGTKGVRQLLVVPIAFVSDHIETLNEIDLQFADEAHSAGIPEFRRTPGLNDHPTFLQALADIASSRFDQKTSRPKIKDQLAIP